MNLIKKSAVALASVAALSIGATSVAKADSYAYSNLEIIGLTMSSVATGNVLVLGPDVSLPNGVTDNQTNTATLTDMGSDFSFFTTAVPVLVADADLACVGDCGGFAQNDFTEQPQAGLTFSRGDTLVQGAIIDVGFGTGGVSANSVSETQIARNTTGIVDSKAGTNTSFDFTVGADTAIQFDFTSDGYLFAEQTGNNITPPSNAFAASSFNIKVEQLDAFGNSVAVVFNWSPDGSLNAADVANGVAEISDTTKLTTNAATNIKGTSDTENLAGTFSAQTLTDLVAGGKYRLVVSHQTNVQATAEIDVPEPDMLFLLGLGLAGFAVRKRQLNLK